MLLILNKIPGDHAEVSRTPRFPRATPGGEGWHNPGKLQAPRKPDNGPALCGGGGERRQPPGENPPKTRAGGAGRTARAAPSLALTLKKGAGGKAACHGCSAPLRGSLRHFKAASAGRRSPPAPPLPLPAARPLPHAVPPRARLFALLSHKPRLNAYQISAVSEETPMT